VKKNLGICLLVVMVVALGFLPAQAQTPTAASVVPTREPAVDAVYSNVVLRLDPALDAIVSADAKLEVLKGDYFGFVEGPAWKKEDGGGYLLFSDIAANRIYKWDPKTGLAVFLEHSGYTGSAAPVYDHVNVNVTGRIAAALIGSNGLTFDREGRLIVCTHGDRTLYRVEKDGTHTVLADKVDGKRLSGPNDAVVKSDGSIYFSDRGSGLISGNVYPDPTNPSRELDFNGILRWKDGKVDVIIKALSANGMAFSPDEKYLYLTTGPSITRYDVKPDGTIANPKVMVDTSQDKSLPGGPDGVRVDRKGNIWTPAPGGVWVVSPEGKLLGKIRIPNQPPANLSFGDDDGKGLYLVGRNQLSHIRLAAPGI
jgi:gluconolactonase